MHVQAGAPIFRTGDPSLAVYVIEDGEVAITVDDSGTGIEVARLTAGALFGESGVLECRTRSATATAITATNLLVTEAETFLRAFGLENDRALALVKLLCSRLRSTTQRAAHADAVATTTTTTARPIDPAHAAIRLLPDHERLISEYGVTPLDVRHVPFPVGNRYGGETVPVATNHACCIAARNETDLAAPHFEILKRDGGYGIRDLGSRHGTIVNGTHIGRKSLNSFFPLHAGDNQVIAGLPDSPFRFRIQLRAGAR